MTKPPDSTKTSLRQKLAERARERWPQLTAITVRHHGEFAYVAGQLPDGTTLPLMRLRYTGSAAHWGFAVYRASHDDYEKSLLPSGLPFGTPQEALDCACGLYLGDATAWLPPPSPTNLRARPLVAQTARATASSAVGSSLACAALTATAVHDGSVAPSAGTIPSVSEQPQTARQNCRSALDPAWRAGLSGPRGSG